MKKVAMIGIPLVALVLLIVLVLFFTSRNNAPVENNQEATSNTDTDSQDQVIEETATIEVNEDGSIPFSRIGKGILDAKEDFPTFKFENGTGTCMDQGFPNDMIYSSENIVMTEDGSYSEDYTAVDFLGNIRFDGLTLSSGSAACMFETSADSDNATVSCSVDEVEVCTASFQFNAYE